MKKTMAFLLLGFLLFSCSESKLKVLTLKGSTDNKLEVLNFGGKGEPMLFLAGLGNSAHVFADFAPKFCNKYHVYAMTRRGFGASEQTSKGYGIDTLSKDILAVINALNLGKVILIGHSIAGDEVTKFASSYPDKVKKIIYLDAAHDRFEMMKIFAGLPHLPQPNMTKEDSASLSNVNRFLKRTMKVAMPDEELVATNVFDKNGKYIKDVTSNEVNMKILSGVEHPNYKYINCSALAIYAKPLNAREFFSFYDTLDSLNKKTADSVYNIYGSWVNKQKDLFKKEVKNGIVKEINSANHYIFISHPVETENMIRDFLRE